MNWSFVSISFCCRYRFPALRWAQDVVSVGQDADPMAEGVTQMANEVRDMPVATTVRLIMILTALTFVPAMLLVMTPFTRFIIVFSMLRQALGFAASAANQVLIGLALCSCRHSSCSPR